MAPHVLPVLGPSGERSTRGRQSVPDVTGAEFAELCLAPPVLVGKAMSALRAATPLSERERLAALARAAALFADGVVGGFGADEYSYAACRVGGMPLGTVEDATRATHERLMCMAETLRRAKPSGATAGWRDDATRGGCAVWTRAGEVLAVHASGVHPGAHGMWPEALAMGYRVAVRPTRREPFTAHRMVAALRAAGFPDDHVMLLPTEAAAAEGIVAGSDFAYGGDEVIRRHEGEAGGPVLLVQRPGRSKILLGAGCDWRQHVDTIVDSVAGGAGGGCVNATAVLVEGDPVPVAEAVAERLTVAPSLPPEDEKATLPVQQITSARATASYLRRKAGDATVLLGAETVVAGLGDGSAALRPAVHVLDAPDERIDTELPFPCVWFAPWHGEREPLRDTLTLTVVTRDESLVDRLLAEPTIANLHLGDVPTDSVAVGLPHDGYLADALMRTKAVIRETP